MPWHACSNVNYPLTSELLPIPNGANVVETAEFRAYEFNFRNAQFGYVNIPSFFRPVTIWPPSEAEIEAFVAPFRRVLSKLAISTKGIVIDIRGNDGGMPNYYEPILTLLGASQLNAGIMAKSIMNENTIYTKPVVLLIDSSCHSACEIFADAMKGRINTQLVGETTGGAVAGASIAGQLPYENCF